MNVEKLIELLLLRDKETEIILIPELVGLDSSNMENIETIEVNTKGLLRKLNTEDDNRKLLVLI